MEVDHENVTSSTNPSQDFKGIKLNISILLLLYILRFKFFAEWLKQ